MHLVVAGGKPFHSRARAGFRAFGELHYLPARTPNGTPRNDRPKWNATKSLKFPPARSVTPVLCVCARAREDNIVTPWREDVVCWGREGSDDVLQQKSRAIPRCYCTALTSDRFGAVVAAIAKADGRALLALHLKWEHLRRNGRRARFLVSPLSDGDDGGDDEDGGGGDP